MHKNKRILTKQKPRAQHIVKLEYYDGVTWQTLSNENYVEDKSLVPAAVLGAFLGTAGTVWYKKKKENK